MCDSLVVAFICPRCDTRLGWRELGWLAVDWRPIAPCAKPKQIGRLSGDIDEIMAEIRADSRRSKFTSSPGKQVASRQQDTPRAMIRRRQDKQATSKANYSPVRSRYFRTAAMPNERRWLLSALLLCSLAALTRAGSAPLPAEQQAQGANKSLAQVLQNPADLVLISSSTPATLSGADKAATEPAVKSSSVDVGAPDAAKRAAGKPQSHDERRQRQDPIDQMSTSQSVSFAEPNEADANQLLSGRAPSSTAPSGTTTTTTTTAATARQVSFPSLISYHGRLDWTFMSLPGFACGSKTST